MKTLHRILLELFGPSVIGGSFMYLFAMFASGTRPHVGDIPKGLLLFVMFAVVFCGIQSVLYTIAMEWAFRRGCGRRSAQCILLSTALGVMSGAVILLFVAGQASDRLILLLYPGVGAAVGLLIGTIIFFFEPKNPRCSS